ncbi:beta-eliminating lyase-related protein [Streptomyces sp. SID2119]|uniref:threonine aldolase family protein n=1 Tax=Streptomyces sp. SID2119 TaxID=2690253 RepID=UPI00136AFC60|nr:beta-eliminating lyase-related protein [Streptomyces sp. SID2119]MYW32888.1 threonine aldolase [Streptomyces sp. SID2119]
MTAMDEQEQRRRRLAAWRGSHRVLARRSTDGTVAEGLAALAAAIGAGSGAEAGIGDGSGAGSGAGSDTGAGSGVVHDPDDAVDVYGGGVVADLERRVAGLLGTEAAAFFPTGTMAQQVALRCWAGRTGNATVALHPLAHPELHEEGSLGAVSGLRTVHLTSAARMPSAEEVRDHPEPFGTLMLELPLRDAGFVLPTWDELEAVVAAARERDAVVHLDGARLWECGPHFGRGLQEIAALADSVYVSFYKSLDGLSGAVLAGSDVLVEEARVWRHRYGGQLFQQYPAALSALIGLDRELPRLPSYVAHAKVVASAMAEGFAAAGVPWFRVHPEPPHTHQFQVWLPYDAEALDEASLRQAEETGVTLFRRWGAGAAGAAGLPPGVSVTEVTVAGAGLEWSAEDVREAVGVFVGLLE